MLAVCTTTSLVLLDPSTLKKAPSSFPPTLALSDVPTSSIWTPDNGTLFVANESAIHRYDATGTSLGTVSTGPPAGPITALASKDRGDTLIYGDHDGITVVDTNSGRVAIRLDTHTAPVSGLALAPDASLLASIAGPRTPGGTLEVHVHDLASASHVELQGLPKKGEVAVCAFHTHSKSKLLVASGTQLLVYDVAKAASPPRVVQLDRRSGDAVAIACSPFSKSLVAVGCNSGVVNLIDLDKEKGLFRTLPLEARLTSLVFSPEGAALYGGTEDGAVLVLDLRALDKPAKSINISPSNERVICLAVQRKLKPGEASRTGVKPATSILSRRKLGAEPPSPAVKSAKSANSTLSGSPSAALYKPRPPTTSLSPGPSPARAVRTRTISATSSKAVKPSPKAAADPSKSTPPTPRTRPVSTAPSEKDVLPPMPPPMRIRTVSSATSASSRATSGTSGTGSVSSRATKMSASTSGTSVGTSSPTARKVGGAVKKTVPARTASVGSDEEVGSVPTERPFPVSKRSPTLPAQDKPVRQPSVRSRTVSATSARSSNPRAAPGPSEPRTTTTTAATTLSTRPRSRTTTQRPSATTVPTRPRASPSVSPIPPVPALPEAFREEQLTEIDIRLRTPSPSLPEDDSDGEAYTPIPMRRRDKGKGREAERPKTDVLGLGTPELKKWIAKEAVQDEDEDAPVERRKVDFLEVPANELQIQSIQVVDEDGKAGAPGPDDPGEGKATIQMTVRVSPRRSRERVASGSGWGPLPSLFSPSRNLPAAVPEGGSSSGQPSVNPAHELLQSLIRDAMYDFRRETKSEILGLHLDLVRMGRGWRKEMREALEQWGEELKEIRRENEFLRKENERLRRGY